MRPFTHAILAAALLAGPASADFATLHGRDGNDRITVISNGTKGYGDGGDDLVMGNMREFDAPVSLGISMIQLHGGPGRDVIALMQTSAIISGGPDADEFHLFTDPGADSVRVTDFDPAGEVFYLYATTGARPDSLQLRPWAKTDTSMRFDGQTVAIFSDVTPEAFTLGDNLVLALPE